MKLKAVWKKDDNYYAIINLGKTEILLREDRFIPPGTITPPDNVEIIFPIKQSLEQDIENPMIGMLPNLEEET